jgi:2-phospho-L-lactate guanylyltransferase
VTALLRLPVDIPLVRPGDVEALFAAAGPAPTCVLIPSRDGTGTNALLRSPARLFPSHFGENSLKKHLAEANSQRAIVRLLRNPRIELDVDDRSDLEELIARAERSTATGRWLHRAGLLGWGKAAAGRSAASASH